MKHLICALGVIVLGAVPARAGTTFGFGSITGNNAGNGMSLGDENYTAGSWKETNVNGVTTTANNGNTSENIDCVVAVANFSNICGNPGPNGAANVSIPADPGTTSILPSGTTNFLMVDGDFEWGAPVSADLTGLTVGSLYQISFYQASSEEDGNNKAYSDSWMAYLLPGASGGVYLCPQSYCGAQQTSIDSGDLVYTSAAMANGGAVSTDWELETFNFSATNTSEVLEFVTNAIGTSGFEPPFFALAGVELSETTPEPSTWTLTILGFGLILAAGWLRRRFSARA
jgi:hypothetical protein